MTREDVIRMAREAGFESHDAMLNHPKELQRFAALAAAAEREACAQVCEEWLHGNWHNQGVVAAMMIRARGQA